MAQKHQQGWLKKEKRSQGETWVLFFRTVRKSDGKRVENKVPIVGHLGWSSWARIPPHLMLCQHRSLRAWDNISESYDWLQFESTASLSRPP